MSSISIDFYKYPAYNKVKYYTSEMGFFKRMLLKYTVKPYTKLRRDKY